MAAASNIPRDMQESIGDILDKHVKVSFKRLVKMEIRPDRMESRILALSPCRLFLLTARVPSKLECSFHFLDIQAVESKKSNQLTVVVEGKTYTFISVEANSDEMDLIITHIGTSLKQIFPSFPLERLIVKIDVQPGDRLKTMNDMIKSAESKEQAPCGGFTMMYQCMCDYHGLPFRDEVAWDVDTIYHSHDSRELRLQDFDHLSGKELVPIIGALEHNAWFKRLNANNVKLAGEACSEIIRVMKRNAVLEEVSLSNTGIKAEFVQKFALAVLSNSGTQLTSLDLSNNLLEDKAIFHLFGTIKLLPCGLTSFDVSKTGLTTRCLNRIGEVLLQAPNILAGLAILKINDNGLRGDDFPMLYTCLAQPNAITYLDVSFTDCALDALCDPLLRGCPNLATLKASRTVFTHKKNKDVNVPMSWKHLFSSMCCLEHLDLSNCRLPVEALKDLMLGLSSNRNVQVYLDLSSNEFGMAGANVLASCITSVASIKGLDISNNGFDIDLKVLLPEIARNSHLKHLSIGRNFANIKPKHMPDVMDAVTLVLQEESSGLESLSLADSRLRADTTYIINALGSNNTLQEIDISGNLIGDLGARLLAKALLINTRLSKVIWDKNAVSAQGFEDVAEALQKNMTLKKMPYPVNDAAAALRLFPERTEIALEKIESFLQRNHSPRRFASDNAYRLQQGFLINSTQQILDRIVVQVQDTVNALRSLGTVDVYEQELETADKLIADANNSRQLFSGLQNIAIQSQVKDNSVDLQLQEMANSLRQTIEEQLQKTANDMLKCTQNFCPEIMTNSSFQSTVKEGCLSKVTLPRDFTQGVLEAASTDIYNISSERNLENAAFISDSVIEAVIDSLTSCHKALGSHLNLRRSGYYADKEQDKIEDNTETAKLKNGDEVSQKIVNKRKSLLTRKTRPQSTVVHDFKMSPTNDGENELETSVCHSLPIFADEESEVSISRSVQDRSDLQELEEVNTELTPSRAAKAERVKDFVDLPAASRPLEHVTKGRPRREKMHRPTRPVINTGTTDMEEEISNGPQRSISTQVSHSGEHKNISKEVKEETSIAHQKQEQHKIKPDDTSSKKWMPGFMKKSKDDKESKDTKKSSFGSSFSNIFKKKDDKRRPSASEPADIKGDVSFSSIKEQGDIPLTEGLEVVREAKVSENVGDFVKVKEVTPDMEIPGDKCQQMSKREKPVYDRVAILPPLKKIEARSTPLATAEVTTLEVTQTEADEKQTVAVTVAPSNETESHKDEVSKFPTNVSKMPGFGVLGGKNLLQEMKQTQEKRFSRSLLLEEDDTNSPKVKEGNKKTDGDNQRQPDMESSIDDAKKVSKLKQQPEPAPADGHSKKDLNDNTSDPVPSSMSVKPSPPPQQGKAPTLTPRTVLHAKRPVSTVEEGGQIQEIPQSMTASTPELLLGDSPGSKPRPTPPVKPRPPVLPRPKKRDSGKDLAAEETLAIKSPSSSTPLTDVTDSQSSEVPDLELRTKPAVQDEGVVTDSATLRLSVKDKIKRLSQAKGGTDISSPAPLLVQQKTSSLPRDTSLNENLTEELEGDDNVFSNKTETTTPEREKSALKQEDKPILHPTPDTYPLSQPDDEIMV
ncbi:hypothetical protein BsWGS_16081 [Bradybaena similaris]